MKMVNSNHPIDVFTFTDNMEDFLDKNALRFPENREITIRNFFSPEGVCGQIYWKKQDWDLTEQPLWKMRSKYGIYKKNVVGKFCNGYYMQNSLIRPRQIYQEADVIYISNTCVHSDGVSQILNWIKECQITWLQASESVLEILMRYGKAEDFEAAGITYIEVLNSVDYKFYQDVEQMFQCPVVRVWMSPLFGYCAYAQDLSTDITILKEQISLEENCGQRMYLSTLVNRTMPLLHYAVDAQAEHVCAGCVNVSEKYMLREALYFPAEIINEKVGRIIKQLKIKVDSEGKIMIHFGICPTYWNWRKELEQIYRNYLEELIGVSVNLVYVHTCNWLGTAHK